MQRATFWESLELQAKENAAKKSSYNTGRDRCRIEDGGGRSFVWLKW